MSIDKQDILNELGNVVNKLQSADCGCPHLRGSSGFRRLGECSEGCCHGRGANLAHTGGEPVIGNCNPTLNYHARGRNFMKGGNAMPGSYSVEGGNVHNANHNMQKSMASSSMQQHKAYPRPGQMFPAVTSGDLGSDPMAIAVQMNPENKKIAAIYQKNQMKKMMGENKGRMSNNLADANAKINFASENSALTNQLIVPPSNHQTLYGQPNSNVKSIPQNLQYSGNMNAAAISAYPNQQQLHYKNNRAPQQPVYTVASASNQVPPQQQDQYRNQQQKIVDSNAGAPLIYSVMNHEAEHVDVQQQGQGNTTELASESQLLEKDRILPVNTSRQMVCEYNTLGQPVYFLPAIIHSTLKAHQSQTLSPQPPSGKFRKDILKHHVKSIMSKTSLIGNMPVGSTLSRNQLQSVYHQYKGSHSNTQQHIANPADQSDTYSERQLGAHKIIMNQARQAPVETVGGDTAANNRPIHSLSPINKQPIRKYDDVPGANKPNANITLTKEPPKTQGHIGKLRNGLQDKVFSAYPTSAGWSFYGRGKPVTADYQLGRRPWL